MFYRLSFYSFFILGAIFALTVSSVFAIELNGKVTKVTQTTVTIKLEKNLLPQIGDSVAISEYIPGLGSLPLEGEWKVISVSPKMIMAEPVGEASQPQAGQVVIIQSSQPSTATTAKEIYQHGWNYLNGKQGLEKDATKAFPLIQSAASQGYVVAQAKLGYMYSIGLGVAVDKSKSFIWSRKAAIQGNIDSQYNVALDYFYGNGVTEDKTEATNWFRKAANQGHLMAQTNMGLAYYKGYGVVQDYAQAAAWYTKTAQRGDTYSQWRLGLMSERGEGVPQSFSTACNWYKKAATKNHILSQKTLGFFYWDGKGVPQDKAKAFYWFRKAARLGDKGSQGLAGMCYKTGIGTTKDIDKAIYWYRKAADQGDKEAQKQLVKLNATAKGHHTGGNKIGGGGLIPAGAAQMIAQIKSSDGASQQRGAKLLFKSSFKNDPAVLAVVQDELLKGCTMNLRDKRHVDAMAWLCKILGTSGVKSYQATLKKVSDTTKSRKIKKFARKNAAKLR